MAKDHVPSVQLVNATENNISKETKLKHENLIFAFKEKYDVQPDFIARAPGRVNLIGEHIDYCGYSVLPMAIEHDICAAVKPRNDGVINISNTNSCYGDFSATLETFKIQKAKPRWHNYVLCGIKGVLNNSKLENPKGMDILVHGVVPQNAGLSSSSALVCVSGLSMSVANDLSFTKTELAKICMECERYIGTIGGGMDQSISFLAKEGIAKLISFNPIRTEDVNLPNNAVFVITHSCDELNKASTSHYNVRVAECKIAVQILANASGVLGSTVKTFFDLQTQLKFSFVEMLDLIQKTLHEEVYLREEVLQDLNIDDETLKSTLLSQNTLGEKSFELFKRSKHVISEAKRVFDFRDSCMNQSDSNIKKLGELMNASHESCSKDYDCSCEALDVLTQICRQAGALGSRLTGAGWGGCCVSIVPSPLVTEFMAYVKENYYDKNPEILQDRSINDVMFSTQPGMGAMVFTV